MIEQNFASMHCGNNSQSVGKTHDWIFGALDIMFFPICFNFSEYDSANEM